MDEPVRAHISQSLPRKTLEAILHSLRFQQSRAEKLAEKWADYQHLIIKYKPDEAVGNLRLTESYAQFDPRTCHVFEPNPPIWQYGHIWRGVNPFYHGLEVWLDLAEISKETVRILEDSGRMTRREMPPEFDRDGQRNRWPCRLLEFVHYHADQNRPGSLLRSTPVHEFNGLEIPGDVEVWKLSPRIFDAISLSLAMEAEEIEEQFALGVVERNELTVPSENKPTPTPETTAFPILLGEPEDEPIVRGKVKNRLTPGQYRVVKALIDAHPERLGKDTLARRSETEDPIGMIDRLRKDPDWESVLDKPGQAHGGYGIRMKRARKSTPRKG